MDRWGTLEPMYISHPFYSCFYSQSGTYRSYACRSHLYVIPIYCILHKVHSAHWKCIIRFCLYLPSDKCMLRHQQEGVQSTTRFSCVNALIFALKWRQWVFINVLCSKAFFKTCLTFAFYVVHISAWMVLQSKTSCFIFTSSLFNWPFKTVHFIQVILTICLFK